MSFGTSLRQALVSAKDFEHIGNQHSPETVIGEGTFGKVYLVHKFTDKAKLKAGEPPPKYAMKVIKSHLTDVEKQKMFIREVSIVAAITHPCCLSIKGFSFGDKTGSSIVVTPYMEKPNLQELLKLGKAGNSPDDWDGTAQSCTLIGLALGIAYLHSKDIIHRDLKPANIFLDEYYEPRIADFGLSRIASPDQVNRTASVGTPLFMAPEQYEPNYDHKVDVFAFGLLVFCLMFNRIPFTTPPEVQKYKNDYILYMDVKNGARPIVEPHEIMGVPPLLFELMEQCCNQLPQDRPEMVEIVEAILANKDDILLPGTDIDHFDDYFKRMTQDFPVESMRRKVIPQSPVQPVSRPAGPHLINFDDY